MKDALIVSVLSLTPKRLASSWLGRFAHTLFSRPVLRLYVWFYGVNLSEAVRPTVREYTHLSDLFTRALRPDARPIEDSPGGLVSPVDGTVAYCGPSKEGLAPFLHHRSLDLARLLHREVDPDTDVVILYLSPKDYHRVHTPCSAHITEVTHLAGKRWPVFPSAIRSISGVFEQNERVIMVLKTPSSSLTLTMVAAFGVGHMIWPDGLVVSTGNTPHPDGLNAGDWLATFDLGSTVILTVPHGTYRWLLTRGQRVQMGQAIAKRTPHAE